MKKIIAFLFTTIVLISCKKKETGLLMDTASTIAVAETDTKDSIVKKAAHVVPTANQYSALQNEFIAFIHFGPNTFTRMEWGNGMEDPKIFNLQNLDTDQWCKSMADAQMKMVIITVKHHDGFVLWQSRYTKHGIMSTPYKNGEGDILRELAESCKKYGLKLGVYLSPADLYQIESKEGLYGNLSEYTERTIPRPVDGRPFDNKTTFTFKVDDYNEYILNQLFELLTEYGPIDEVWFDGAHPKRKGNQQYNYMAWKELIQKLAPKAVIFGRQDIRWCGNEAGKTRDTEWNIIPYKEDPNKMNRFADLTDASLGQRKDLYDGKYLHYQQAETNTSIRAGWFYRDDVYQKVRSADDVFDIYERSVGGNSTFLLNIPPNREGKFSPEDVSVLKEVGSRIRNTYDFNLFESASGSKSVLDGNTETFELLNESKEIVISLPEAVTINRFVIQEAIATHSERVEKHAVDAWIDGAWKEIANASNIGYKRILRFPEVTSEKFRFRVLESRMIPAISTITAHYYKTRPPQLSIARNEKGTVSIQPKKQEFAWHYWIPDGDNITKNLSAGYEIRYTTDGSEPNKNSKLYSKPFALEHGDVKAVAIDKDMVGSVASSTLGIKKSQWKIHANDSYMDKHPGEQSFDENPSTYWLSKESSKLHYIALSLGEEQTLTGFLYTPQTENSNGMIEEGTISISSNGKNWKKVEDFKFGNLINDPTQRRHDFKKPITTKYIKIESKAIAGGGKVAAIAELDFLK